MRYFVIENGVAEELSTWHRRYDLDLFTPKGGYGSKRTMVRAYDLESAMEANERDEYVTANDAFFYASAVRDFT